MTATSLLVDAHVHFHRCFDRPAFFDRALANFERAASDQRLAPGWAGCLLFSESRGDNVFHALRRDMTIGDPRWRLEATEEDCSLIARREEHRPILLAAGRQIVTAEKIEVLALATSASFDDGRDLPATLDAVFGLGAVAVLPWGFGKWWFKRGKIVRAIVDVAQRSRIFLGDNGGRLAAAPGPPLFARAARRGILVLPGSDPLPMPAQINKVGGYGFILEGAFDTRRPAAAVKRVLDGISAQPKTYGRLETSAAFCRNQIMMQLRKRARAYAG